MESEERDLDVEELETLFCDHPYQHEVMFVYAGHRRSGFVCSNCGAINPGRADFPDEERMPAQEQDMVDALLRISCNYLDAKPPRYTARP